ncbi:MAG: PIN domain-containing protein [Rhodospirillaceae bacterium]|nr:PIN domain-containing protein [Rhodospirillaceae bacterium]
MLDTDVIVAALRSDTGASRLLVEAALRGEFDLLLSVPLALEYEAVVMRPQHCLAAGLSPMEALFFVDKLISVARPVDVAFSWRPQLADPDDEFILDLAVNGRAEAVVTFNTADFAGRLDRFGIAAMKPKNAWRILGNQK